MSITQTFRNSKGTLITRVYKDKRKMGRPKGVPNSTYTLSEKGLKTKQRVMRKLCRRLLKEGRTGWPKGVSQSKEHRAANSAGVKRAIAEGRFDPRANIMKYVESDDFVPRSNHGTHGSYYSRKNRTSLRYDSSWELRRFRFLEHNKSVKSYEKTPLRLVYEFGGRERYYFPDLLIKYKNGDKVLEEIKPKKLAQLPISKAKFKVAKVYCSSADIQFRVIKYKEDLKH